MDKERISQQLRELQQTFRLPNHRLIGECHIGMFSANVVCEDTFSYGTATEMQQPAHSSTVGMNQPQEPTSSQNSYFGVFDGHNGNTCSLFLKDELLPYMLFSLHRPNNNNNDQQQQHTQEQQQQHHYELLERAFKSAFINCDTVYLNEIVLDNVLTGKSLVDAFNGSCAVVAYISEQDNLLTVANAGDCRVILGQIEQQTQVVPSQVATVTTTSSHPITATATSTSPTTDHGMWKDSSSPTRANLLHYQPIHDQYHRHGQRVAVVEITKDHTVENPVERQRLLREHPREPNVIWNDRVKGFLEPTRAFGDALYKSEAFHDIVKPEFKLPPPLSFPYVTAEPDVFIRTIDQRRDRYLVMATDGLYEFLNNQQVVDMVHEYIQLARTGELCEPMNRENIATYLIRRALAQISRTRDEHETLVQLFKVPKRQRRLVHDDMTVVVLVFKNELDDLVNNSTNDQLHYLYDLPVLPETPPSFLRWSQKRRQWSEQQSAKRRAE